ncbi:MAG: hypothetical protein NC111_00495 [Bacteroides sp.]|nr:hypothetical protein [Bacteroides sp.]MCM1414130.1 hypothetical protein [Bacteroides sp.]MCM1470996.1 hypothetical protein [Bacteroides sp.]
MDRSKYNGNRSDDTRVIGNINRGNVAPQPGYPGGDYEPKSGGGGKTWIWIVVILVVIATGAGIGYYIADQENQQRQQAKAEAEARHDSIEQARIEAEAAMVREQQRMDSINLAMEEAANRISVLTFCSLDPSENVMAMFSSDKIRDKLLELGFRQVSETYETDYDDFGQTTETVRSFEREKYGYYVKVLVKAYMVEISFSNSEKRDQFLASALDNHYRRTDTGTYEGPNPNCYWYGSDIQVNGNTVTAIRRFEP